MRSAEGFSLIELCVVFALLGCMVMLSMHLFSLSDRMVVRFEVDTLYALFTNFAQRAVFLQQPQKIKFDIQQRSYILPDNDQIIKLPDRVHFGVPHALQRSGYNKPVTFVGNSVLFHSDGKIQPGSVYLSDLAGKFGYALTCSVAQISYIRRYVYEGNMATSYDWVLI
jgi:hypothetical protein